MDHEKGRRTVTAPTIHPVTQGEAEWMKLRIGRVTASEAHNLLTPEFEIRKGEMPKTYLYSKIAEAWRGTPLPGFSSWATEQGQELEAEARAWFCLEYEHLKIRNVGFIEGEDGRCGCSPDALIDDDSGLELKAPEPTNHVRWLIEGGLPKAHAVQVHFSMFVSQRPTWRFVSYRRHFPAHVVRVERSAKIEERISDALAAFYAAFDGAMGRMRNA